MDELIQFLTTNTQMARFTRGEVKEVIEKMIAAGWDIPKLDKPRG